MIISHCEIRRPNLRTCKPLVLIIAFLLAYSMCCQLHNDFYAVLYMTITSLLIVNLWCRRNYTERQK